MMLRYEPVTLDVDHDDGDGLLVYRGDALLAIASQLSASHDERAGWWFVEYVFRLHVERPRDPFPDMNALGGWLDEQIG